jgi:hypothetical protein
MKKILSLFSLAAMLLACNNDKKEDKPAAGDNAGKEKAPVELLDSTLVGPVKASLAAFAKADMDGFTANFEDTVKFRWSSGDSLIGKQAIKDYYQGRWKLIDTWKESNDIYLPIMAHKSPNGGETAPGKWMLQWYMVDVKYKNNKELRFWVHNAMHYSSADKVDQIAQYIDRHPIMEATKDLVK